jgi:hypothetical protein
MGKHTREVGLDCPVPYCPRKGERSFYRPDRLSSHLQIGHTEDEPCPCPEDGCHLTELSIKSLRLHSICAHRHLSPWMLGSTLYLLFLRDHSVFSEVKCELKKCKKRLDPGSLQKHLGDHGRDRDSQRDVILRMGFDPSNLHIIFPICKVRVPGQHDFLDHLEELHLTTNFEHWKAFKATISEFSSPRRHPWNGDAKHVSWTRLPFSRGLPFWRGLPSSLGLPSRLPFSSVQSTCAYCGAPASCEFDKYVDHHLSLLITSGDIMRCREAIARLIPEFLCHPVFDDIRGVITASPEETPTAATL